MKITVIGAGNVGATVADTAAQKDMAEEVVLIDIKEGLPQGKALDIQEAAPILGFDTRVTGTNDYADTAGSDIGVITAGLPRKPGMSRDDLLAKNAQIVESVTKQFVQHSPDATIIVVSNPLDVMAYVAYQTSGFPSNRVIGMAGVLDTARFRTFLSLELGISVRDIQAMLMGGHGDTMVPLPRFSTVSGTPIPDLLDEETINSIVERTKGGGGEIVELQGASGWYAPGAAVSEMCEAIIKNNDRVLPCAAWVTGEYDLEEMFIGVPARLGKNGIEEIIELNLNEDELQQLEVSADHVRENLKRLERVQE